MPAQRNRRAYLQSRGRWLGEGPSWKALRQRATASRSAGGALRLLQALHLENDGAEAIGTGCDDAAGLLYPLFEDKYFASCYNKTIGSLIQYDQKNKGLLVETLQTYFDNNMNKTETAQALYIHIETLRYRLKKIEKLTGLNMNDSNDLLTLQLGMKFCQMRGINQVLN